VPEPAFVQLESAILVELVVAATLAQESYEGWK
jgi:hypothetical protein